MTDRWFSYLLYESTVHLYLVYSFVSCLNTDMRELGKVQRRTMWMLDGGMEWLPVMEELSISGQEKRCLSESLTSMTWRFWFFTWEVVIHRNSAPCDIWDAKSWCGVKGILDIFLEENPMQDINTKTSATEPERIGKWENILGKCCYKFPLFILHCCKHW